MAQRVVVLGGGFGGVEAAIGLDRLLPKEDEILLVSEQNFLLFTPLLPQIASSRINPRHIVQTVRDIRGKRRFRFRRFRHERLAQPLGLAGAPSLLRD